MPGLRVALFVEGSTAPPTARGREALEQIWNQHLGRALGLQPFAPIVPIGKTHLVAMDPRRPPMSGAGERLDQLMARVLTTRPFDAAVVAWDLVPAWNPQGEFCRWNETVDLYRFLAESDCLPAAWKEKARRRFEDLSRRHSPASRSGPPALEPGMVLPLCMEPMFETLLVQDEAAARRALGVSGRAIHGWPRQGWGDPQERHPDDRVLAPAIRSLQRLRPRPRILGTVRGDMRTNKDGWGEYLLRQMLGDERARPLILSHALSRRLSEARSRAGSQAN